MRNAWPEHFWNRVDKTESCWLWMGYRDRKGYGHLAVPGTRRGSTFLAHRVAWELINGSIPDGMFLCHNCPSGDNPSCVNPAHLFIGTNRDNIHDAWRKGRGVAPVRQPNYSERARGVRHGVAKLTDEKVFEIRRRYEAGGVSQQALADEFGVHQTQVSRIIRNVWWQHVA